MEIFTLIIALIGAAGTIYNIIASVITNSIKVNAYFTKLDYISKMFVGYIIVENKSKLPISIVDICVKSESTVFNCSSLPKLVIENKRVRNHEVTYNDYYSIQFPINLQSLNSFGGYLSTNRVEHEINLDKPLVLELYTNRNKTIRCEFLYSKVGRLHRK